MPRIKLKSKCKLCKKNYVAVSGKEFPICVECHMRQVHSEPIEDENYKFLEISDDLYESSKFLRSIRVNYNRYKELTPRQIEAFKETLKKDPEEE